MEQVLCPRVEATSFTITKEKDYRI